MLPSLLYNWTLWFTQSSIGTAFKGTEGNAQKNEFIPFLYSARERYVALVFLKSYLANSIKSHKNVHTPLAKKFQF